MPDQFDDRVYLELILSKSLEHDEKGNPIIYAEASNEGLDQQEQIVLQRALMDAKEYFLRNGVISYDHKHLRRDPTDPDWNPEKYIIGEPMAVVKRGDKTFVKARLFQSSPLAREIISKLEDGAKYIRTSVGGLRPIVEQSYDPKLKRPVERVVSVMWNELAITPRPVNDSLSPVTLSSSAFVKSMSMGYVTDSASATGGGALGVQDLQGVKKTKKAIHAVVTAIAVGDVRTPEDGLAVLEDNGVKDKEASDILEEVVNRRKQFQEVFRMDAALSKSFEESIEELAKAMKTGAPGAPAMPPAPMPAPAPAPHAEPDADNAGGESDGDEDNEDEDEDEKGQAAPPAPPAPPMKKGVDLDEEVEFLDVSPVLSKMAKSLKAIQADNRALAETVKAQGDLIKSMGSVQLQSAQVLKSITDQPSMRKSVLDRQSRFSVGEGAAKVEMTPGEVLRKSTEALSAGKISLREATIIEDRINKGIAIEESTLSMLKSL